MRLAASIVFALSVGVIGFVAGDIYGGYATGLVSTTLSVLLVLASFGASQVVSVASILNKHYSEPQLVYEKTVRSADQTYYLRVRNKKGKTAKNCYAEIAVLPALMTNRKTVWEHENAPAIKDIDSYADLRLFQVTKALATQVPVNMTDFVRFPSANSSGSGWADTTQPFNYASTMTVRIRLVSDNARVPKEEFSRTVLDIVQNSEGQTP